MYVGMDDDLNVWWCQLLNKNKALISYDDDAASKYIAKILSHFIYSQGAEVKVWIMVCLSSDKEKE